VEREVLISSPWDPVPGGVGVAQSHLPQGRFRLDMSKPFFAQRVLKPWNRLPREVLNASCHSVLQSHLGNALKNML